MAKAVSFIMAIIITLVAFISCGKKTGTGESESTTVPSVSVTEFVSEPENETDHEEESSKEEQPVSSILTLKIGGQEVPVTWEDNESVAALSQLSSGGITVSMSKYGGFEQVGSLGTSLPRNDKQTTTSYGDIVLYQGNQIVIFYGSNSWSYTRLGHINLTQNEMSELLSNSDVEINLKYE